MVVAVVCCPASVVWACGRYSPGFGLAKEEAGFRVQLIFSPK